MKTLDLKQTRNQFNLSQEDLAFKSGLTVRTIQRIENGGSTPRQDTLDRICKSLHITMADLYFEQGIDQRSDERFINILKLSQFLFPFYFLGFIVPFALKSVNKDKSKKYHEWATEIINFQFSWYVICTFSFCVLMVPTIGVIFLVPIVIFIIRFRLFKDIKWLNSKKILQAIVLSVGFILLTWVLNFGMLIMLGCLNLYMVIRSLNMDNASDFNTIFLKIPIVKKIDVSHS